jgi:hypothetical protein
MAPADVLEMLRQVRLPNVTRYVVTIGKFDTDKLAKTFNIEAGYPADPPHLETLSAWAVVEGDDARLRDARDLFALRAILSKERGFDFAAILRSPTDLDKLWPDLMREMDGKLFATVGSDLILFNLRDERAADFIERLWDLHYSGAVYAVDRYTPDLALAAAAEAVWLEQQFATD